MQKRSTSLALTGAIVLLATTAVISAGDGRDPRAARGIRASSSARGPSIWSRDGRRARSRTDCASARTARLRKTDFSIGHRGACLQFPEHTKESYEAAARMGAGIVECDVTFTKDGSSCAATPSATSTRRPTSWPLPSTTSARVPWTRPWTRTPRCCTSDLTLAEFKTPAGQDGRERSRRRHAGGVPGRDGLLAYGPLHGPRHPPDLAREHRTQREERRQAHARAEGRRSRPYRGGLRRPGAVRAGAHRRPAGGRTSTRETSGSSRSTRTTSSTGWQNAPQFGRQAVYLDSVDPTSNPPVPR